jgi:hypothetical protein
MGGCIVEMEVALLDTLAMNTLRVRETKKTFLEVATGDMSARVLHFWERDDSLLLVPEGKGNVHAAVSI